MFIIRRIANTGKPSPILNMQASAQECYCRSLATIHFLVYSNIGSLNENSNDYYLQFLRIANLLLCFDFRSLSDHFDKFSTGSESSGGHSLAPLSTLAAKPHGCVEQTATFCQLHHAGNQIA